MLLQAAWCGCKAPSKASDGDCYPTAVWRPVVSGTLVSEDPIVDPCSPMMVGVSNPIVGNSASHVIGHGPAS